MSEDSTPQLSPEEFQAAEKNNPGCGCFWFGILIAFSPAILAGIATATTCGGNASLSTCGEASIMLLEPMAIMVGVAMCLVGIFMYMSNGTKVPPEEDDQSRD